MKKFVSTALALFLLADLAGCATLPKKFVRKKKEPKHKPSVIYTEEGPYQKKFSNAYYYQSHFTQGKAWIDETLQELEGNQKRLRRNVQEAVMHWEELGEYLDEAKKKELEPWLQELGRIRRRIETGTIADSEIGTVRTDLERIQRGLNRGFQPANVGEHLKADEVPL